MDNTFTVGLSFGPEHIPPVIAMFLFSQEICLRCRLPITIFVLNRLRLPAHQHTTIRCSSSADGLYPGTSSRVVTLSSASAAALDAAQSLVLLAVAQGYGDAFREVGVVVSDAAAGRIIGRAGAQIATLREGCERCELTPRDESSNERTVIISGDVAQMTCTVRGIIDLIMETLSE